MYQVRCGDNILYDARDDELTLYDMKLSLEVNKAGSLSFVIYPQHPYFEVITKLQSIIEVVKNNRIIFKGRVMSDSQGFYCEKRVECEGKLAFFNDSIFRAFEFKGSPNLFFKQILDNHNNQVKDFQKLKTGIITVSDPNDYINRSSETNLNSLEVINTRLLDTLGGYLSVRYEEDGDYLDYLKEFINYATQPISFGENLLNLAHDVSAEETYTAMIPMGADVNGKKINISSVNNGLDYIVNQKAAEKYGIIYAPEDVSTWSDVTLPINLLKKAQDYLNNLGITLKETLELSAVDLNLTDAEVESFNFCDYIRVLSGPHNIYQTYLLRKLDIDIGNPQNTKITLGESKNTLTEMQFSNSKKENGLFERVSVIEKDYVTNGSITEVVEETTTEKVNAIMGDYLNSESILPGNNIDIVIGADKKVTVNAIVPVNVSELANDSEYQTKENVLDAIKTNTPSSGSDGFSPTISEKENTDISYILTINDKNGMYDTPNLKGAKGLDGESGTAATIEVGSVVTGNPGVKASVENVGTDHCAILNFIIPKGDPGEKGDVGSSSGGGSSGMFALEIDTKGHLILHYDGSIPNMKIDGRGHLIYEIGE